MRTRLTRLGLAAVCASASCGCSLEPLSIGYVEAGDDVEFNASAGEAGRSWSEQDLLEGVVETELVGPLLDLVFTPELSSSYRVIIELHEVGQVALPPGVEVVLLDGEGVPVASGESEQGATRFEAVLAPGWYLRVSSEESVLVEVEARIEVP